LSVVAMLVIVFFFVTSSDSGSLVLDMLASGGSTQTPVATRVYWAVLEGVAAAALLVVGGSVALTALQTLSISTALPFSIILVLACWSLLRAFRHEVATMPHYIELLPASGDPAQAAGAAPRPLPVGHPRRRLRTELGGVSATPPGTQPPGGVRAPAATEPVPPTVLPSRPLGAGLRVAPETGQVAVEAVTDPLAGEVFQTAEFVASQEFLDQNARTEQD